MMRRLLIAPVLVWCGTVIPPLRAQAVEEAAVRRVVAAVASLQEANDIAGMDTLFGSDPWVEIIEGSGVNQGWTDYRNNQLKPELAEMQHLRKLGLQLVVPVIRPALVDPELAEMQHLRFRFFDI